MASNVTDWYARYGRCYRRYATQCTIPRGGEFTYSFKADSAGTAWYHGHWFEQYTDGLYGSLIIRRQTEPNHQYYDSEQILMVADWYDESAHGK